MAMNALRFLEKGPLTNLTLCKLPKPTLQPGEALVRVKAAGINGSDAANVKGFLPFTTVPRVPGRDYSGQVVEVAHENESLRSEWIDAEVWGSGGERGFSQDGTFAEYVKVPIESLSRKPKSLDHVHAASILLPWICAWIAVDILGEVKAGDNVLIIGARGGIGSGAAQLCLSRGANVYGTYRSLSSVQIPPKLTPIEISSSSPTPIRTAISSLGLQNKIDVLLDCAGYPDPFNDALFTLTPSGTGRVVVMAAHRPDGMFPIDLRTFYTKALTMRGLKSSALNQKEVKELLDRLSADFDRGVFTAGEVETVSLTDEGSVRNALEASLTRSALKRSVVVP